MGQEGLRVCGLSVFDRQGTLSRDCRFARLICMSDASHEEPSLLSLGTSNSNGEEIGVDRRRRLSNFRALVLPRMRCATDGLYTLPMAPLLPSLLSIHYHTRSSCLLKTVIFMLVQLSTPLALAAAVHAAPAVHIHIDESAYPGGAASDEHGTKNMPALNVEGALPLDLPTGCASPIFPGPTGRHPPSSLARK